MLPRIAVAVLLVGIGCSRSRAPSTAAAPAVAAAPAAAPHDLARAAVPAPLSCRALESCTDACSDAACAESCVRRLTAAARPAYDALQACVVPACADAGSAPCRAPGSFACKACVLAHCATQAAGCMAN